MDMECGGSNSADHSNVVSISVFVAVICLCILVGHLLEENRWVNESITAIIIGCITGTLILFMSKGTSSHILRFDENLFFIYLLPPIIFNAGFQVKKKHFFRNFGTIMLFGVIGVFISSAIISAGSWWLFPKIGFLGLNAWDYLAIGTIFSSTDTVCTLQVLHQDQTPLLYSLVFGEGVVNDATSVVLFNAIHKIDVSRLTGWAAAHVFADFLYLFSTSTALGISAGLLTAYALKALYFGRHSTDREIALMSLMAYLSYMLAELLHLSGILTVFFCGIVMSHYAWHNVSENSRITSRLSLWSKITSLHVNMEKRCVIIDRLLVKNCIPLPLFAKNFLSRARDKLHVLVVVWRGILSQCLNQKILVVEAETISHVTECQ